MRRALIYGGVIVAVACSGTLAFGAKRIVAEDAAYRAPAGPRCVSSQLNRSALLPGTSVAVSPLPDSYDASPRTQISLLGAPASALSALSASGSSSGPHPGRLLAYSQGDGASFVPSRPFAPGESVTVHGRVRGSSGRTTRFTYRFVIAHQDQLTYAPTAKPAKDYNEEQHFHSAPTLQPPVLAVSTRASEKTAPGYLFTAPYNGPGPSGPEIFNDSGELVWFDPLAGEAAATNLQVQQYAGRPVLTWWQGYIPPQGFGQGEEMIYSTSYRQIGRVHAGNGYKADLHEFHITPNGAALLSVFDPIDCNLSAVGGPSGGAVTDSVFQEVDMASGLVRREWHSLDHVGLSESYSSPEGVSIAWPFDFFHINSIDQLADGTTLISARNTWALYELSTTTGQVGLRVGGKRSQVKLINGAATAFQHDATVQTNGTVSVFDNGAVPKVHPQSRAIFLSVDPRAHTDTLLARYEHPRGLSSASQGSMQTLPGGNVFVGWGSQPYFSEFSAGGQLLYDAHWHGSYQSYRAYRFAWTGTPAGTPAIAASATGASGSVSVYASWNGATGVASWRVLAGASPSQLAPAASAAKSGFETTIATPGPAAYVAVQALDSVGTVLGTSPAIKG